MGNNIRVLNKFNRRAEEWLSDLQALSEEEMSRRPATDSWSMGELYDHIMKVARTYQIPNFKISLTNESVQRKRKNKIGFAIFNLGIRKQVKIRMEDFPAPLVQDFTPAQQSKEALLSDFKDFIEEVNVLHSELPADPKTSRHYHPMFGDIHTGEWFSLIEIHMAHHEVQRRRIRKMIID